MGRRKTGRLGHDRPGHERLGHEWPVDARALVERLGRERLGHEWLGRERLPTQDPSDPRGMVALLTAYLSGLLTRNYSRLTVVSRAEALVGFARWLGERGVTRPSEVTCPIVERYQRSLFHYRKANGQPLSIKVQHGRLFVVRAFFRWLAKERHVLYNPASEIELPRLDRRLPRCVLTASEAEAVINQPDVQDPLGLRDRAILETFYSTGMRRMELVRLKVYDLDVERGTVMVRQGKGRRDRLIPIGDRAVAWIERYLVEVRAGLVVEPDEGVVFLTQYGTPFVEDMMSQLVRQHVDGAHLGKRGSCHLFRHTMATLMLENGSDVRFIQEMLGHASLATTQIYTQVSIRKLKEIHTATHPARLERCGKAAERPVAERPVAEPPPVAGHSAADFPTAEPLGAEPLRPRPTTPPASRDALLAALFAEDEEA